MEIEKIQQRSYRATSLAGIFFGAAFMGICLPFFRIFPPFSWQYFLMAILPSFLIYLVCGFIVLTKWGKFSFSQKSVLVGIGVHYILNFLYGIMFLLFSSKGSISTVESWLIYYPRLILAPLDYFYNKFIIMPRTVYDSTGAALIKTYIWETGLIFPILRIVYAGFIGFCFGKIFYLYRNGYLSSFVNELSRYSYISFVSIIFAISGYVLSLISEEYFILFFLFSILSIVFGHISKKRIIRSELHIKGKWLSIAGLLLGYTLLVLTIITFFRFNNFI